MRSWSATCDVQDPTGLENPIVVVDIAGRIKYPKLGYTRGKGIGIYGGSIGVEKVDFKSDCDIFLKYTPPPYTPG